MAVLLHDLPAKERSFEKQSGSKRAAVQSCGLPLIPQRAQLSADFG